MLQLRTLRAIVATAAILVLVGCTVVFVGCSELSNREDFSVHVKDKTEAEVLKYAGKPAEVDDARPGRTSWIYKSRTFEVSSRKTDANTVVIFSPASDGKLHVTEVLFEQ
jgi:hypothetical protein